MDLDDWITRIRSLDSATFEDAYEGERPSGPGVIPRLVAEMHRSPDGYTRGKFLELLGEMGDENIVQDLIAELSNPDSEARLWAALALEKLGIAKGIQAAEEHRKSHPEDFIK